MKKKLGKKIAVFSIVTALVVAMLPVLAFADGNVAKIGGAQFTSLEDAVSHAEEGATITLLDDVELSRGLDIGQKVTLDLNGKKITTIASGYSEDYVIDVLHGGDLTIIDSSVEQTGVIDGSQIDKSYGSGIKMTKKDVGDYTKEAILTVKSGTIKGKGYGIGGNGNPKRDNTVINIEGGTIEATNTAKEGSDVPTGIYQPQKGILNITGGLIKGLNGVYVKSGTTTIAANVTGGTIMTTAKVDPKDYVFNGNGAACEGYAFVVDNAEYPGGEPNVSISGGKFVGPVESFAKEGNTPIANFISGGVFTVEPNEEYLAEGFVIKKLADGTYGVVDPSVPETADFNNWILWAILGLLALGAAVTVVARKKEY